MTVSYAPTATVVRLKDATARVQRIRTQINRRSNLKEADNGVSARHRSEFQAALNQVPGN
jgi:hypothetical protein